MLRVALQRGMCGLEWVGLGNVWCGSGGAERRAVLGLQVVF